MSIVSNELDYKSYDVSHGSYQYTQLTPINGTNSTVTVTTGGGQESIWEVPMQVINLGKSFMRFDISAPAVGGNSTNVFLDTVPFRQIQVYNRNRVLLADITDVNKYVNMIGRYENKIEDVKIRLVLHLLSLITQVHQPTVQ